MRLFTVSPRTLLILNALVVVACLDPVQSQTIPRCTPPPDPTSVSMASEGESENLGTIGLSRCTIEAEVLSCSFAATKTVQGRAQYFLNTEWKAKVKLYDNLRVEHPAMRAYFVNGHCQKSDSVSLAQGDWIWFTVEFGQATDDITNASVTLPKYNLAGYYSGQLDFRGPVGK